MFTIIELQTTGENTTTVTPIPAFSDIKLAYQKYYQVLSAAAVSSVEVHTAMIIDERGGVVRAESFDHREEAE